MRERPDCRLLTALAVTWILSGAVAATAEEKNVTPLSGGVPVIEGIKMLEVGAAAPDFTIRDTEGNVFRLLEDKAQTPTLLVFWSIFCEPCRFEMPVIQKLQEKYGANGTIRVAAIALDGEPLKNSISGFVRQEGYTFRILVDELDAKEMFKVADPYGVAGTPTVFLVDRNGKIVLAKVGRIKEEELEKAVQSVLKK